MSFSHLFLPVEQHQLAVRQDAVFPLPCRRFSVGGLAAGQSVCRWSFHICEQKTATPDSLACVINHLLCFCGSAARCEPKLQSALSSACFSILKDKTLILGGTHGEHYVRYTMNTYLSIAWLTKMAIPEMNINVFVKDWNIIKRKDQELSCKLHLPSNPFSKMWVNG